MNPRSDTMFRLTLFPAVLLAALLALAACSVPAPRQTIDAEAPIFPDYKGVTVPPNIAPLNFGVSGAERLLVTVCRGGEEVLRVEGDSAVDFDQAAWHRVLGASAGQALQVTVAVWNTRHPEGASYRPFTIHVAQDAVDDWMVYRLIPPGYENYNRLGIFQRDLTSFEQRTVATSRQLGAKCLNCHHFLNHRPDTMMLHVRGRGGGTLLKRGDRLERVLLNAMGPGKNGTYPAFHPGGRYIVYSSNVTHQAFYGRSRDKVEVYDLASDLMVYDLERQDVLTDARFNDTLRWETFPAFAPDGRSLYFCTAPAVAAMPRDYDRLHYSLCRVDFDAATGCFGQTVDTLWSAARQGGSVSLPRLSPDGRYLLFTHADCATFPIWHREADLRMLDLQTGELVDIEPLNSDQADSYHAWSSNGRWVVLSSRRLDGRYTRLFLSHFKDGRFSKPFLLPQRDPWSDMEFLYAYNIPEFIQAPLQLDRRQLEELFRTPDNE